jgi:hypothetical protein
MNPTREDTWFINVAVGDFNLGTWDTFSGGEADSEESKYRPGGMDEEISLGGRRTIGNVTVARYYDILRDHPLVKWLYSNTGKLRGGAARVPMNMQGVLAGEAQYFGGTLKRVSVPDTDSMGSDAAMLELEFTIDVVA